MTDRTLLLVHGQTTSGEIISTTVVALVGSTRHDGVGINILCSITIICCLPFAGNSVVIVKNSGVSLTTLWQGAKLWLIEIIPFSMAVTAPVRHSVALNGYPYMCQICKRLVVYLRGIIEVFTQHIGLWSAIWGLLRPNLYRWASSCMQPS
jgi:hypothetical protein